MDETQQPQVVGTASLQEGGAGGLRGEPWAVPVPAALPCPRSTNHVDWGWSCRFTPGFTPGFSVYWVTHSLFDRALCQALGRGRRPAAGRCLSLPLPYGAPGGGEAGRRQVVAASPRRPGGVKEGPLTRPGGWGRVPDPLMGVGLGVERRWVGGPRRGMCSDS